MKPVTLPAGHYAAGWDAEEFNSLAAVNALGRQYAEDPEEELLLELCRCFHPYWMKYLGMICRGHLPCIARHKVHPESKKFLQLFLAKGEPPDQGNLLKAARGLHNPSGWSFPSNDTTKSGRS